MTPIKPTLETMASIIDHDRNVSFTDIPKYSLNIQKPESFTCENMRLPAPMERTIRLGLILVACNSGNSTLAAVRAATVADPIQPRIMAVIIQAKING